MIQELIVISLGIITGFACTSFLFYIYDLLILHQSSDPSQPVIITIEGNIAAGKSTLVKQLQNDAFMKNNCVFVDEPLDEWLALKDDDGKNILEKFYENQKLWAFPFQIFAWLTKYRKIQQSLKIAKQTNKRALIIERSHSSDLHVFMKALESDGTIDNMMLRTFQQFFKWGDAKIEENHHIYLYCSPEDCNTRLEKRSRKEENSVSFEYLETLHRFHEEWLNYTPRCVLKIHMKEVSDIGSTVYQNLLASVRRTVVECINNKQ